MSLQLNAGTYGEGPDLVLLHGLFGSHENLRNLGKALSAHYRIHALDLRNHGGSFHSDSMTYFDMANDVLHYLKENSITQTHIIGHSMGGKVAMQTALLFPRWVSSLSILDMAPVNYEHYNVKNRHTQILYGLKKLSETQLNDRTQANAIMSSYVKDAGVRAFLLKNLRKSTEGSLHLRININAIIDNYPAIADAPKGTLYDGPTLFLKGEYSDYILPAYRNETLELFPKAKLKVIKGTSHWLHAEKPIAIYNAIHDFLSSTGITHYAS